MKFTTYLRDGAARLAVLDGQGLVDLNDANAQVPSDLRAALKASVDLQAAVGTCGYVSVGSSLKFCIVAEGEADIYPRASPTSEWDTAAGHAVLLAAGGLVDGPDGTPLRYGKSAFLNRAFVATSGWKPPRLDRYLELFAGGGDLPAGV